jgi:hypothetical protein
MTLTGMARLTLCPDANRRCWSGGGVVSTDALLSDTSLLHAHTEDDALQPMAIVLRFLDC